MTYPAPRPRRVPVLPRPRHGELSASYAARLAAANRTDFRTIIELLGPLRGSPLPRGGPDLAVTVLTVNDAAFARLLGYTGLPADRLVRAIPSLAPVTFEQPGEPAAVRVSYLQELTADCPGCFLRRRGAYLDVRLFPHKTLCLRHGYWLFGEGRGQRLDLTQFPQVAAAQHRLNRAARRRGPSAVMHAYRLADSYLRLSWRVDFHPSWYPVLVGRWEQCARAGDPSVLPGVSWQFPQWAMHAECTALSLLFASSYWAELAVPAPDRRHKRFYQRLLTELGVQERWPLRSVRDFAPLPGDIQDQARWGRLLNSLEWGDPPPLTASPRHVPFFDLTDEYEKSVQKLLVTAGREVPVGRSQRRPLSSTWP